MSETNTGEGEVPSQDTATPATDDSRSVDSAIIDKPEFSAAWDAAFPGDKSSGSQTATDTSEVPTDEAGATADNDTADAAEKPTDPADKQTPPPTNTAAKPGEIQEAIATLTPSLVAAAKRAGYSDEDLAKDIASLGPERVSQTLERWHGAFNDLSSKYAALGRASATPINQPQPSANPGAEAPSNAGTIDALFEPKALVEFEAEYGKGIVEKVLKPLMAELQPLREIRANYENQQRASLQQEINTVFGGIGSEYEALYGKGGMDQVSEESRQHRLSVLREADFIKLGYERAGMEISNKEAIERAHNLYVAPRRAEFERKSLASKVQKRAGGITARPTQRRTPSVARDGAKKGLEAAQSAVSKREADLGIEFFED